MANKLTKKVTNKVKPVTKPKVTAQVAKASKIGKYTFAVGRRKVATAKTKLFEGKQELQVNGKLSTEYFKRSDLAAIYLRPLVVTDTLGRMTAVTSVSGSGLIGQAEAVAHSLARALAKLNPEAYKLILRKEGLLTRDPRMKETRKVGQGGKARKKKQSPKR